MTDDAAKLLQMNEKKNFRFFNYTIEGFVLFEVICDAWGQLADLRFLQTNPAFETLGYLKNQVFLGKTLREVVPDLAENWFSNYDNVIWNGAPARFELYSAQTDRWYNVFTYTPNQGQIAALFHDVTEQKQIEKALQKSEEKYRQLVELAQEGIWVVDRNEITTFVNPCMARMLGYSVAEMQGKHFFDFMDDQGIAICRKLEGRRNGIKEEHDFELIRKDGTRIYTIMSVTPIYNDNGEYTEAITVMTDITERRLMEEALKRSEEKLRTIFESSPVAITLIGLDRMVLDCNQVTVEMLGLDSKEELIGKDCFTFIAETEQSKAREAWQRGLNGGSNKDLEIILARKDQRMFYGLFSANLFRDSQGKPYAMVIGVSDITKRRENEMKYSRILATALNGFCITDLEGKILEVNEAYCRMLGYSPKALLAMSIADLETIEKPNDMMRHIQALQQKKGGHFLARQHRKDGSVIDVEINATHLDIGGGRMVIFVQDITEPKKGEEALRESRERFRKLFYQSPIAIELYNAEGRLIDINQACLEMLRITDKESTLGRKLFNTPYIPPDARGKLLKGEIVRYETTVDFEKMRAEKILFTSREGQGDIYVIMSAIKTGKSLSGYLVLIEDFTDRNRTKAELMESQFILEAVIASMNDGLAIVDTNGNYIRANDAFARICKFSSKKEFFKNNSELADLLEGYTLDGKLIGVEDVPSNMALRGEALSNYELVVKRKDTNATWVANYSFAPVRDLDGNIIAAVTTVRDTTEQKKIEETLREADRRKDEFLAILSHELRNPLASIQNSIHILNHTPLDGEQGKRAKEVIQRQAGQLSRLVDDLLDITRITQNKINLQRRRLEVNELVRRTIEDHRILFEKKGVRLEVEYSQTMFFVEGDEARLGQVVGNLLQNAAKFTKHGGHTRVSITGTEGERAVIRIVDSGIGMAPETFPRLFQPFMQANMAPDRSHDGLGLGLALSRGLIEMHGGEITANSAGLGKGSEFVVYLPLQEVVPLPEVAPHPEALRLPLEEAQTLPVSRVLPAEILQHRLRVLIIDDNIDLAESLHELLELYEHEVAVAYNGFEGLTKAREFQPEVILCDIGLPGMDGYEVAKAFRGDDLLKNVVLVALTGYAQPKDSLKAAEAGFHQYLVKPVDLDALEQTLARISAKIRQDD